MLSKFKDPVFILSLVATVIGLLLSLHVIGAGTALYRALGGVLVLLSDLGIQAIKPLSPASQSSTQVPSGN